MPTVQGPSQAQLDRIERDFTYHPPLGNQAERYTVLRNAGKQLALTIAALTPTSREQSLALTKLEEAVMWSNAAIARNEARVSEEPEPAA